MEYIFNYNASQTKRGGFTLIELLVVIAIIGILASVVLAALGNARQQAKVAKTATQIRQIQKALIMYMTDHGYSQWPPDGRGSEIRSMPPITLNNLVNEGYLAATPKPPIGAIYQYREHNGPAFLVITNLDDHKKNVLRFFASLNKIFDGVKSYHGYAQAHGRLLLSNGASLDHITYVLSKNKTF